MNYISDLHNKLFNIAKQNTVQQEPDKKKFVNQKNAEYESKIRSMANLEKLKPFAEKGNYHANIIDIDGTFDYTCYDLQRLVEKINEVGDLPLKVYYEKGENLSFDHNNLNTWYHSVSCKASFRWGKVEN